MELNELEIEFLQRIIEQNIDYFCWDDICEDQPEYYEQVIEPTLKGLLKKITKYLEPVN